jgi:hypothetical protein
MMIAKVVKKQSLKDHAANSLKDDLIYWLEKSPEERIACVEYLRRQVHGTAERLQRSVRVFQRT